MIQKRRETVPEPDITAEPVKVEVPVPAAPKKRQGVYEVIGRIRHLGQNVEPGELVEFDAAEAARLIRLNAIREI